MEQLKTHSQAVCPQCDTPATYLYDVPIYEQWSNADSQRMHRKFGCEACDVVWTEPVSPNVKVSEAADEP